MTEILNCKLAFHAHTAECYLPTPRSREAEIAARLEKITRGDWRVVVEDIDGRDVYYVGPGSTDEDCAVVGICSAEGHEHHDADNADFVAHAPDDLRYLLAQLQRARQEADAERRLRVIDATSKMQMEAQLQQTQVDQQALTGLRQREVQWQTLSAEREGQLQQARQENAKLQNAAGWADWAKLTPDAKLDEALQGQMGLSVRVIELDAQLQQAREALTAIRPFVDVDAPRAIVAMADAAIKGAR